MKKVYLIAVVIALLAGFSTYLFANEIYKKTSIKDADTTQVVVAVQQVEKDTLITEEMLSTHFKVANILAADAVPDAVTDLASLTGIISQDTIYPGEQVNTKRLISSDSPDAGLSLNLPEGYVAYSIAADNILGVSGFVKPGDTVDILIRGVPAYYILQDVPVLKVASNSENEAAKAEDGTPITTYSAVTLCVTEADALALYDAVGGGITGYQLVLNRRAA